jgi:hypothetical protein
MDEANGSEAAYRRVARRSFWVLVAFIVITGVIGKVAGRWFLVPAAFGVASFAVSIVYAAKADKLRRGKVG